MKHVYPSGTEKRKMFEEKHSKTESLPKLTSFFETTKNEMPDNVQDRATAASVEESPH